MPKTMPMILQWDESFDALQVMIERPPTPTAQLNDAMGQNRSSTSRRAGSRRLDKLAAPAFSHV